MHTIQMKLWHKQTVMVLTVKIMHSDSKIAPQQPKNAIKNIAEPIAMNTIGTTSACESLITSKTTSYLYRMDTPSTTIAIPPNCKSKRRKKKKPFEFSWLPKIEVCLIIIYGKIEKKKIQNARFIHHTNSWVRENSLILLNQNILRNFDWFDPISQFQFHSFQQAIWRWTKKKFFKCSSISSSTNKLSFTPFDHSVMVASIQMCA